MSEYLKVVEDDVFKCICRCYLALWSPGIVSCPNIASLLKTSKYQVKKHINTLKEKELVKSDSCMIQDEYESWPPYNGFTLTDKGKKSEVFLKLKQEDDEAYRECAEFK